uniref:Uncharacterized protein n=1 Tax=Timema tahoe TaxID=61484 RepID=A0A7R9IFV1_9NEOP|nr:unnamed protein product [Timema tahoe]
MIRLNRDYKKMKLSFPPLPLNPLNLPSPENPYRPEFSDLDYADVDYRSYGPINYKKASIDVLEQQNRAPSVENQQRPTRPPKNPSPDLL